MSGFAFLQDGGWLGLLKSAQNRYRLGVEKCLLQEAGSLAGYFTQSPRNKVKRVLSMDIIEILAKYKV